MVGASAAACAQNLKSASFTGTFSSGWTFASTGVTGNGTSAFMNTNLSPFNNLINGNFHLSCYANIVTTNGAFSNDIAIARNTYNALGTVSLRVNDKVSGIAGFSSGNDNTEIAYFSSTTSGFAIGTETSNSLRKFIKNNVILITNTANSITNLATENLSISGFTGQNFSTNRIAFVSIGDGLTDAEAANFYTRVQAFQTTLNRQINP
jgi:hypothetical protein